MTTSRPRGIQWDAQPLGVVSDCELARRLGVTRRAVSCARHVRGIAAYVRDEADWLCVPLGLVSDAEAARIADRSESAAAAARKRRGIPPRGRKPAPSRPKKWEWIDWGRIPLGAVTDADAAHMAGVHRSTAAKARRRILGLGAIRIERVCLCGNTFAARRANHIYCSNTCAQATARHRFDDRPPELEAVRAALAQLGAELRRRRKGR